MSNTPTLAEIAQQVGAAFASISDFNWVLVLLGILVPIPAAYFPHIRQSFHQWRLDRRLARDPIIYQDELQDYEYKIGEELDEVEWRSLLWRGIGNGFWVAALFALQEVDSGWTTYVVLLAVTAVGLIIVLAFRGSADDYDDDDEEDSFWPSHAELPSEAIWGFAGAVSIVLLMIVFATWFL